MRSAVNERHCHRTTKSTPLTGAGRITRCSSPVPTPAPMRATELVSVYRRTLQHFVRKFRPTTSRSPAGYVKARPLI